MSCSAARDSPDPPPLLALLRAALTRDDPTIAAVADLIQLSGGASRQTFAFDAVANDGGRRRLILRRDPPGAGDAAEAEADIQLGPSRSTEYDLLRAVAAHGVPAPCPQFRLIPADGLGEGYVMAFTPGETVPRRILRDPAYAVAREQMAAQCGAIAGAIHAIPADRLPDLPRLAPRRHLAIYRQLAARWSKPLPTFELALRRLDQTVRDDVPLALVHGDFRNGNLIVGPEGVRAVLDWELSHFGDPYEDLGWICVKSWRFGVPDRPVGGFGQRDALFDAYAAATGRPVDRERARFWELFGALRWGVMCTQMAARHLNGAQRSIELAAIGRRISETEHDLLELLR